jgi:hypothetical protein
MLGLRLSDHRRRRLRRRLLLPHQSLHNTTTSTTTLSPVLLHHPSSSPLAIPPSPATLLPRFRLFCISWLCSSPVLVGIHRRRRPRLSRAAALHLRAPILRRPFHLPPPCPHRRAGPHHDLAIVQAGLDTGRTSAALPPASHKLHRAPLACAFDGPLRLARSVGEACRRRRPRAPSPAFDTHIPQRELD